MCAASCVCVCVCVCIVLECVCVCVRWKYQPVASTTFLTLKSCDLCAYNMFACVFMLSMTAFEDTFEAYMYLHRCSAPLNAIRHSPCSFFLLGCLRFAENSPPEFGGRQPQPLTFRLALRLIGKPTRTNNKFLVYSGVRIGCSSTFFFLALTYVSYHSHYSGPMREWEREKERERELAQIYTLCPAHILCWSCKT